MRIPDILKSKRPVFSFEFYPPKTEEDARRLFNSIKELAPLRPDFVSITHSSTGTAPYRTVALSGLIKKQLGMEILSHLTCIAHTREEISGMAEKISGLGIENILALRGDPFNSGGLKIKRDYAYAYELINDLKKLGNFAIGAAGYPEKHPESGTGADDIKYLKMKMDAGADFIITQLFFDNRFYFEFAEKCAKAGINTPIIPGIMPVTSYRQIRNFTGMFNISIPKAVAGGLFRFENDRPNLLKFSIDHAAKQCVELIENGAPGVHFYTLNHSKATKEILALII
ncbi:MAG: methylenetetrahydrofolate reductase [NAD(P)H] [Elusimicrobia bacterium]|nr:methylenetetrahydrofolate reductase [NAD(P)H] [Elusimicrobiota bacterium]